MVQGGDSRRGDRAIYHAASTHAPSPSFTNSRRRVVNDILTAASMPGGAAGDSKSTARESGRAGGAGGARLLAHGEQQVRFVGSPTVAHAKIDRGRAAACEQLAEVRLVVLRKHRHWAEIAAERLKLPRLAVEIGEGDSGIVLQNGRALHQQEIPDPGEALAMHQIGGALDQAVRRREPLAELEKSAARDAAVLKIGAEIIERLRPPVGPRETDLHAVRRALDAGTVGQLAAVGVEG